MSAEQGHPTIGMSNTVTTIPIRDMYEISTRQNAAWGIEGYEPPKQYLDPKKIVEQRENKKTPAPRALKKGDYLTETLKANKGIPGPNAYNIVKPWFPEDKKGKPAPGKVPHKTTFLDLLAKNKVPGPGAYNLTKSDKEIEEMNNKLKSQNKTSKSERVFYLSDAEYVSNMYPGPGQYNARSASSKQHKDMMDPKKWITKHQDLKKKEKDKKPGPDCGTYNPLPNDIDTFDKIAEQMKDKNKLPKVKTWGAPGDRFRKPKKDAYNPPGPGNYNTMIVWNGKQPDGKKDKKDLNWMNKVSKGIEKSIYYSEN